MWLKLEEASSFNARLGRSKSTGRNFRRSKAVITLGVDSPLTLSLLVLSLGIWFAPIQPAEAARWFPHENCTDHTCDTDHTCRSIVCRPEWESCPPGTVQFGDPHAAADETQCRDTGCTYGGCDANEIQTQHKFCYGHLDCPACYQETCCLSRQQVTCCDLLPCSVKYNDCNVPQQQQLSDPSRSTVQWTLIAHTGTATFPFYSGSQVPAGSSCEGVRRWGRCRCDDGASLPGCDPSNSSTWYDMGADVSAGNATAPGGPNGNDAPSPAPASPPSSPISTALLPANLSLICAVLPPPAPQPPAPSPPVSPPSPPSPSTPDPPTGSFPPPAPPQQQKSNTRGSARSQHSANGGMVALIVVGAFLGAAVTAGTVLYCFGMLPDLHNLRIRSLTTYEPVFTGQSYTPGLESRSRGAGTGAGGSQDIPWTRFCAAMADGYKRLRYGRRYRQDAADAAAAAERYRALNSLNSRGRVSVGAAGGVDGAAGAVPLSPYPGKPPTHRHFPAAQMRAPISGGGDGGGSLVYDNPYDEEDDVGVNEVFTLADLGARSADSPAAGRGRTAQGFGFRPVAHGGARDSSVGAAAALPVSMRASIGEAFDTAPSAARLDTGDETGGDADTAGGRRPRLNQFGGSGGGGGGGSGNAAGRQQIDRGHDVIHTRPLFILKSDDAGGGGGGGRLSYPDDDDDGDLDAPIQFLPSPQVTGRDGSSLTGRGAPL